MKGRGEKVKEFNSYLLSLEIKLYDAYRDLILEKAILTAGALKNKYNGISNKQRMLVPIFQKYNKEVAVLVPKDYSAGTLKDITQVFPTPLSLLNGDINFWILTFVPSITNLLLRLIFSFGQFENVLIILQLSILRILEKSSGFVLQMDGLTKILSPITRPELK